MTDMLRLLLIMSTMAAVAIPMTVFLKWICAKWLSSMAQLLMWTPILLRLLIPYVRESVMSVYNLLPEETRSYTVFSEAMQGGPTFEIRLLPLIWLSGAICFIAYTLLSYLRFVNQLSFTSLPQGETEEIARNAARLTGLKKIPETVCCHNRISPMVVGLLSPKLILPKHILTQLSPEQLQMIFIHEYTHLKRRDSLLNWFLLLLGCLHWFNPFVHWMRRLIRRDSEMVCDACVMQTLQTTNPSLYGKTILDLLENTVSAGNAVITAPMAGTKRTVKGRLKALYQIGKKKLSVLALPLCLTISVTLFTSALAPELSDAVGTVSDLLDPTIVIIPTEEPSPMSEPSETLFPSTEPSSYPSELPTETEALPSVAPTESTTAPSESTIAPTELPAITPITTATPTSVPSAVSTPTPTPSPIPTPTASSTSVYVYQGGGAVAKLSKDRKLAGFSAHFGDVTITTDGIRSATDVSATGFFTIVKNGEIVADRAPGVVRGSVSAITFSTSDGSIRYSFPLESRTTE